MNVITRTGFLPLPPTSYRDPFSEEARPSPSSHFHIHLNPHSCPTIGEHFNQTCPLSPLPRPTRRFVSRSIIGDGRVSRSTFARVSEWRVA